MATKKKQTGRKKAKAAASPPAPLAPAGEPARTVVFVHGIGNKPEPSVLKCQWDRALFGFELGERSRLAYWVDRARHLTPASATCESGDRVDVREDFAGRTLGVRRQTEPEPVEDLVSGLTTEKSEREVLLRIGRALEAYEPQASEEQISIRAVEAKVLPLPAFARKLITRGLTELFLDDVHDYFFVPERRELMRKSVLERLRAGGGPFVVIAHSQGSMIAYDVLSSLAPDDCDVSLFVTIGSPLGLTEVQDQVKRLTGQTRLAVPPCVRRWLNVADPLDPVAFDKRLADDYRAHADVGVEDDLEWNDDSPFHPHSGTGYLETRPVRRAVREIVDTALFQPVSDFVIARDLARALENGAHTARHEVLIELAEIATGGVQDLDRTRERVEKAIREVAEGVPEEALELDRLKRYVAVKLTREEAESLAARLGGGRAVRRIWQNATKRALIEVSVNTVQARPAHVGYRALGQGVSWAVLDTGIWAEHPHFRAHASVAGQHDCTKRGSPRSGDALDENGHGTHVAGIIAGAHEIANNGAPRTFSGIAPQAKLHVYKVLDRDGSGRDAWIIKAIDHIADTNDRAGQLVIHGVNISLGGPFDQSTFGCGHSPLCRELRRLWRQGVVVVIAAGNEGFAVLQSQMGAVDANMDLSLSDPANLAEAIAVGSVHKENPHTYGVSYFSSRGPTADGRQKPDVVAPGERILSCRHRVAPNGSGADDLYVAMSGTSMAAPHVSGILAAFLSVHREFIGYPDRVKELLLANCTDLARDRPQQGAGLPNLMKMLVNV